MVRCHLLQKEKKSVWTERTLFFFPSFCDQPLDTYFGSTSSLFLHHGDKEDNNSICQDTRPTRSRPHQTPRTHPKAPTGIVPLPHPHLPPPPLHQEEDTTFWTASNKASDSSAIPKSPMVKQDRSLITDKGFYSYKSRQCRGRGGQVHVALCLECGVGDGRVC